MKTITKANPQTELTTPNKMVIAGQVANGVASNGVFADYLRRKSPNTITTHANALTVFAQFLAEANVIAANGVGEYSHDLQNDAEAWQGMTWGIVTAFREWMLETGYAVSTINNRLSVVRKYVRLAMKAGTIADSEFLKISSVEGYRGKDVTNVEAKRETARIGAKKAHSIEITPSMAAKLTTTSNGRSEAVKARDNLMMCLLLGNGLRCGELAGLLVNSIDPKRKTLTFYRKKVKKTQTHKLSKQTIEAYNRYIPFYNASDALNSGLILSSNTRGELLPKTMSERAITKRVKRLGELVGIEGLSAHDCRHFWATNAARSNTDLNSLRQAGGWSTLAMPQRYIKDAEIANEGVKLDFWE